MDLRGRVRRQPKEQPAPLVEGRFIDGPVGQTIRLVPQGADYVKVGPFLYSFAGKDEKRRPMYCKVRTRRVEQRLVNFMIAKRGSDPRVQRAMMRGESVKRTAPPAQGRGARRRAAMREAAHASA